MLLIEHPSRYYALDRHRIVLSHGFPHCPPVQIDEKVASRVRDAWDIRIVALLCRAHLFEDMARRAELGTVAAREGCPGHHPITNDFDTLERLWNDLRAWPKLFR